jgi:hypothetical protein
VGGNYYTEQKKPIEYPRSALSSDLTIDGKEIKNPYKKVVAIKLRKVVYNLIVWELSEVKETWNFQKFQKVVHFNDVVSNAII